MFLWGPHKNGVKLGKHSYELLSRTIQKVCKITENTKCPNVKLGFYCSWNLNSSITEGLKCKKSCNHICTCTWMHIIYSSLIMLQFSVFHEWLISSPVYVNEGQYTYSLITVTLPWDDMSCTTGDSPAWPAKNWHWYLPFHNTYQWNLPSSYLYYEVKIGSQLWIWNRKESCIFNICTKYLIPSTTVGSHMFPFVQ